MKVLRNCELVSGQMINLDKNLLYVHEKFLSGVSNQIKRIIVVRQGGFSFIYLNYPICYGRKNRGYFEELLKKVMKRMFSWKNTLLYFGGRYILISFVLSSMPV